MSRAKTVGIISIKGGVGKTTVAVNLAAALASEFGKKVLLADANFSTPHVGLHLGLVNPSATIHDVLKGDCAPHNALYSHDSGFHVMPGSLIPKQVKPLGLKEKLSSLKNIYDVILVDSSPALNDEMLATIMASDELLVVSSLDYPTLSATLHAVKIARKNNTPIRGIILNKVRGKNFEISVGDIERAAGVPVIATLPEDIKVAESLAYTVPITLHKPRKESAIAYRRVAASLIGKEYSDPRLVSRATKWIKEKFNSNLNKTSERRFYN